jgi:predicted adenylyl cyclase CyaB
MSWESCMPENLEIKARVKHFARTQALATALSGAPGILLHQEDTFFHSARGRLKLRVFSPTQGELIYYERHDTSGPKPSHYVIAVTPDPAALKTVLTLALGVRGVVRKHRWLYIVGQTRVHLDEVEGLGSFVELEWLRQPSQTVAEGTRVVAELMQQLAIGEADLIAGAYIDLLASRNPA